MTLRGRLIFGNILTVGLVLVGLGTALYYAVFARRLQSLDDSLMNRARTIASNWPPPQRFQDRRPLADPDWLMPGIDPVAAKQIQRQRMLLMPTVLDVNGKSLFFPGDQAWDEIAFLRGLKGETVVSERELDGDTIRVLTYPFREYGKVTAVFQHAASMREVYEEQQRLKTVLLFMLPVGLLVAGGVGMSLAGRALMPTREMAQAIDSIEASNLSERLPVAGNDEFANVATRFNGLLARLEESFARQRRLVEDASHELRTPLTTIRTRAEIALKGDKSAAQFREHVEAIQRSSLNMSQIIEELLFLAQADGDRGRADFTSLQLSEIVASALELASEGSGARVSNLVPTDARVQGNAHMLIRAFRNLLDNASRHTTAGGTIHVEASLANGFWSVTVRDTGEGISPEHLPHVFDRFYRAEESRQRGTGGTGLGLPICQSIVELHGGSIGIESTVGVGTVVTVRLPKAP